MTDTLTFWTLDWVPAGPRGFVRDLRLRWAAEDAGLEYHVRTVPLADRETNHLDAQPVGQVPFLTDGDLTLFESGACLLHLAGKGGKLMPDDAGDAAHTVQWMFADRFSVADLAMADVLRIPAVRMRGARPASEAYVARATARPAFARAYADQMAHFAAADAAREREDTPVA